MLVNATISLVLMLESDQLLTFSLLPQRKHVVFLASWRVDWLVRVSPGSRQ